MKKTFLLLSLAFMLKSNAQYTPGNLIVLKTGDGTTTLGATATNVTLVQLKTDGTRVDSIAVPSTGNNKLVLLGNSYLDGALRLSQNGQYVTFAGYDANAGATSGLTLSNTNKVIARVGVDGVVDLSTKIVQPGDSVRIGSVITDNGTNFWFNLASTKIPAIPFPICYAPYGTVSLPTPVSDSRTNWRSVNIIGGKLYSNVSNQLLSLGTNLAEVTNPAAPLTSVALFSHNSTPSPTFNGYGYVMFDMDAAEPGFDVAYVLSQGSNTTRGLVKSIKVNGVWNTGAALTNLDVRSPLPTNFTNPGGLIDIAGTIVAGNPTLYVTRGTGANNSIVSITDSSGYAAAIKPAYTTIARAGDKYAFIGISFTPGTTPYLILPLSLLSFNALLKSESVLLKWSTANEVNVRNFEIEKSINGKDFIKIGTVQARNLANTNFYDYSDVSNKSELAFYRLKIVDKNGGFSYSSILNINNKSASSKLSVYPNPCADNITISHQKSGSNDCIKILSMDGKVVNSFKVEPNVLQTTINITKMSKANYLLQYNDGVTNSAIVINKK